MKIGYYIVDPGLGMPAIALDLDTQVRCLFFIKRQIHRICSVPPGVFFDIITVQYVGDAGPALGMYSETVIDTGKNMNRLAYSIAEEIEVFVNKTGIAELVKQSLLENVSWQDVLQFSAQRTAELNKL